MSHPPPVPVPVPGLVRARAGALLPATSAGAGPLTGLAGGAHGPPDPAAGFAVLARGPRGLAAVRARAGMERRTAAALGVLLVAVVVFAVHHFWAGRPQGVVAAGPEPAPSLPVAVASPSAGAGAGERREVVVDVAGKVREPGLYTLPAGARVADAIEAAGGSGPAADSGTLNRARPLADGEQILVGVTPAAPTGGTGTGTAAPGAPLSLNAATAEQLDTLPGIEPVLAASIVSYREEAGGFTSVDQLLDVSGIGETRLSELRDHVTP